MTNFEKTQNGQKNSADVIAKIKTARDEARIKANAYRHLTSKRYDYRRAVAAVLAYDEALALFERGTEHKIPNMVTRAIADFEYEHCDNPTATEVTLAVTEGRKDALASVADWMNNKENNR